MIIILLLALSGGGKSVGVFEEVNRTTCEKPCWFFRFFHFTLSQNQMMQLCHFASQVVATTFSKNIRQIFGFKGPHSPKHNCAL